jgi:uncharacterized protein
VPLPCRVSDTPVTRPPPSIFYLHGFASSSKSTKAEYLGERLRRHGLTLECPDFNQPDFATLTLTRMLDQLDRQMAAAAGKTSTLIGSSLGGTLAILAASSLGARVERLVLLAPAVWGPSPEAQGGPDRWIAPERIAEWRRNGRLPFFHYADNAERMLNYTFYEDTFRYNPFDAKFSQPTLIFQGMHDTAVDPRSVEAFARGRPNVTLSLLDDDHQLLNSLPRIWDDLSLFLGIK